MRRLWILATLVLSGCGPDEDVELLALPPLERPSAEARLGLPEVRGVWRFAGWEVISGDTMSLERAFPTFGELRIETQRLDSLAGSFNLGGTPVGIVGDVRRDGRLALVTGAGGVPTGYLAGEFRRDTLWVELSSLLPADEWPSRSRAAFVRGPVAQPMEIAWLRGAREPPPPPVAAAVPGTAGLPPGAAAPGGGPGIGGGQAPRTGDAPGAVSRPGGVGAGTTPAGGAPAQPRPQQPATQQPGQQQPPATPPAQTPPPQQPPEEQPPAAPPAEPEPQPPAPAPEDQNAPLLGNPVNP